MFKSFFSISLVLGLGLVLTACNQNAATPATTITSDPIRTGTVETSRPADNMEVFSASYTDYQADEAEGQKHVLFFHADWCPTCVKWEEKITGNMGSLGDDVVIYKAEYDTADELKAQYGITKQSQAAFVNADGTLAKTEADPSIESINAFFAGDMEMGTRQEMEETISETFSATYSDFLPGAGEGQKHVLFFHASWCPTCVKWDAKVKDELKAMPDNAVILKVDYDSADNLIEQYGVTKHSTAVFINADGSVAKRELDLSLESLAAFFQE